VSDTLFMLKWQNIVFKIQRWRSASKLVEQFRFVTKLTLLKPRFYN